MLSTQHADGVRAGARSVCAPRLPKRIRRTSPGTSRLECPRHSSQAPRADVHRRPLPVAPNLDPRTRAVRQNFRSAGPPPCCTSSLREWTRDARRRCPSSESSSAHRLRSHSLHTSQCRSPTGCRLRWLERRRLAGLQSCRKQHSQRLRFWTPPACRTSWDSASRRARRRPGGSLYTSRGTCQRAAPPHCPVLRRPVCLHLIRQRPDKQSSPAEHSGMPSSPLCSGVKNYGGKGGAVRELVRNGAVRAGECAPRTPAPAPAAECRSRGGKAEPSLSSQSRGSHSSNPVEVSTGKQLFTIHR